MENEGLLKQYSKILVLLPKLTGSPLQSSIKIHVVTHFDVLHCTVDLLIKTTTTLCEYYDNPIGVALIVSIKSVSTNRIHISMNVRFNDFINH